MIIATAETWPFWEEGMEKTDQHRQGEKKHRQEGESNEQIHVQDNRQENIRRGRNPETKAKDGLRTSKKLLEVT